MVRNHLMISGSFIITVVLFLCPRHKMAEGHIESYLSVCVLESCPGYNLTVHDGI